jgi:hypothetical protein
MQLICGRSPLFGTKNLPHQISSFSIPKHSIALESTPVLLFYSHDMIVEDPGSGKAIQILNLTNKSVGIDFTKNLCKPEKMVGFLFRTQNLNFTDENWSTSRVLTSFLFKN